MKKAVFSRYERDSDGIILIDVAAEKVEDLYSNFDKRAPYIRRDLDHNLVEYIIDCAKELGSEPFTINFSLSHPLDEISESRIRHSTNSYFLYMVAKEHQKIRQMMRRSLILFSIGFAILFLAVWVNQWLGADRSVVANVFAEGLTVAAWVALWEALAVFLVGWFPRIWDIKLYRRLAGVHPIFRSRPEAVKNASGG